MEKPKFFVNNVNTFTSDVPLDIIKEHPEITYTFTINGMGTISTKLDLASATNTTIKSVISYDMPKVDFDKNVAYGKGCGDDGIWFVFDFQKGIVTIEGEDIIDQLGKTE